MYAFVDGTASTLLASNLNGYIEQGQLSSSMVTPAGDGATNASGNGPTLGYVSIPICLSLLFFVFLFKSVLNFEHMHMVVSLTIVMKIFLNIVINIGIKIWLNTCNYLTKLKS